MSGLVDGNNSILGKHFHNSEQIYGLTANTMARKSTSPIVVTGGSDVWGTELELHNGVTIESGVSTKSFDFRKMFVSAVGTANRITILEFYYGTQAAGIACTFQNVGDTITNNGHGLADGTKLMFTPGAGALPVQLNIFTVYYVISTAENTFQVSLTLGGAAVTLASDGSMEYNLITQALLTETVVSRAAVAPDVYFMELMSLRTNCDKRVWCRGLAAGGTNAISFFIGLHPYPYPV